MKKGNKSKFLLFGLIFMVLLCMFSSCGKTAIEKADDYIEKLDKKQYEDCEWDSNLDENTKTYGVTFYLPYESEDDYFGSEREMLEDIFEKFYPKLEKILSKDETIDNIGVMFSYSDGYYANYMYMNGTMFNINDLFS